MQSDIQPAGGDSPQKPFKTEALSDDELGMRKKIKKQQNYEAVDLRDGRQAGRQGERCTVGKNQRDLKEGRQSGRV